MSRTDNMGQPFFNYISTVQLDFAVMDWCGKFFDRVVQPCKDWMDERTWLSIKHSAQSMREAGIEGDLNEVKRLASRVLDVCADAFEHFQERQTEEHCVQLLNRALCSKQ